MITLKMETVGSNTWFGKHEKEFETIDEFKRFILNECDGINPSSLHKLGKWGRVMINHAHGLYSTIYKLDDLTARIWCEHYTETKGGVNYDSTRFFV